MEDVLGVADREGVIMFVAEGAYGAHGWPCHVTLRASGGDYVVDWVEVGDGNTPEYPQTLTMTRDELRTWLQQLLAGGRPVRRYGVSAAQR